MICSAKEARFISAAAHEATKSDVQARLGCIAVVSGKIIAQGYNKYRTYSKDGLIGESCSCHAEVDVLRKCLKQNVTKRIVLYVIRISRDGEFLCSMPCNKCFRCMQDFQIKSIVYTDISGNIVKKRFSDFTSTHQSKGELAIIRQNILQLIQ